MSTLQSASLCRVSTFWNSEFAARLSTIFFLFSTKQFAYMNQGGKYQSCGGRTRIDICMYRNERWVRIQSHDQAERFCRMFSDTSFPKLLQIYSFLDGTGCLNKEGFQMTRDSSVHIKQHSMLDGLDAMQRDVRGVPQRIKNSGLCWYCALCFIMLFCKQMRDVLYMYFPPELRELSKAVLHDRNAAESFRHYLYKHYALGDKPGQRPELDGQNGCSQFFILLARLGVPTIRLLAPSMYEMTDPVLDQEKNELFLQRRARPDEPCILVVRCFRTAWQPKRRFVHEGKRYKLMGLFIGSEHCGHQIGVSTCDMRVCRYAMTDSDAAQHDIGPMFWMICQRPGESRVAFKRRWRQMWVDMLPGILFSSNGVCDMNPVNRPTHELEQHGGRRTSKGPVGVVNTDYVYLHIP